jgi:hypothetical protein
MANNYTIKGLKYDKLRANIGTPDMIKEGQKRGANEGRRDTINQVQRLFQSGPCFSFF